MSVYTFDGEIKISPSLNYAEIKMVREAMLARLHSHHVKGAEKMSPIEDIFRSYMPFTLVIEDEEKETDDGVLTVKTASVIAPVSISEGYLGYSMDSLMEAIVVAAPGHSWIGEIVAVHEDRMTAKKLVVNVPEVVLDVTKDRIIQEVAGSSVIRWDGAYDEERLADFL